MVESCEKCEGNGITSKEFDEILVQIKENNPTRFFEHDYCTSCVRGFIRSRIFKNRPQWTVTFPQGKIEISHNSGVNDAIMQREGSTGFIMWSNNPLDLKPIWYFFMSTDTTLKAFENSKHAMSSPKVKSEYIHGIERFRS